MSDSVNTQIIVVPTLAVKNASAAIAFYRNAFGAVVLMSNEDPDGGVVAEMEMGGARFVVSDESPEHGNSGP